jgi:hypothetical protein
MSVKSVGERLFNISKGVRPVLFTVFADALISGSESKNFMVCNQFQKLLESTSHSNQIIFNFKSLNKHN